MQGNFVIGLVAAALLAANSSFAADSILHSSPPGPCAAAMEGADYVPGADASGQPVDRADIGAEHVAIPDQVYVPLPNRAGRGQASRNGGGRAGPQPGQNGPMAAIDGKRLEGLVNPTPCAAPPRQR